MFGTFHYNDLAVLAACTQIPLLIDGIVAVHVCRLYVYTRIEGTSWLLLEFHKIQVYIIGSVLVSHFLNFEFNEFNVLHYVT